MDLEDETQEFPSTIKQIDIYNCADVTREMAPALLSSIRSVHKKPWNVISSGRIEYDRDDILYIIICPAGFGDYPVKMPKYFISWQLEFLRTRFRNAVYIDRIKQSLAVWVLADAGVAS